MSNNKNIRLSPTQQIAVNHGDGALLVVAGPGSGKTRVLTERIRKILIEEKGHFRILALTFTNKAANEMKDRLKYLANIHERTFIGTLHSFCTEVLALKGKPVGIDGLPQIFNAYQERKQVLLEAVLEDPYLLYELKNAGDLREQNKKCDDWMRKITLWKSHLLDTDQIEDETGRRLYEAYNAGLRASGAIDFDDLLLLTFRLFQERPKIASFYRRLYRYICIDEAQDLNAAQYGVLQALCAEEFKNVMMVGDPKQSIYGFNTADPKLMMRFKDDFDAKVLELNENFRSSKAIVAAARLLNRKYEVSGKLSVPGDIQLLAGKDEKDEARLCVGTLQNLLINGHPDIEGDITLERCAVLGRTRYTLLKIEEELRETGLNYYKQLSANYESGSDLMKEFELCLRLIVNPKDRFHLGMLKKRWKIQKDFKPDKSETINSGLILLENLSNMSTSQDAGILLKAVRQIPSARGKLNLLSTFKVLEEFADTLDKDNKRAVWEDLTVLRSEWNRYLRSGVGNQSDLGSFLTHMALGTTQQPRQEGLALLTVHSSKGLEFDVVFIVGMSEGTFPDYRTLKTKALLEEEKRNAFVAVTRSKRLLYLSYPREKEMPWGDTWQQQPSRFLKDMRVPQLESVIRGDRGHGADMRASLNV
jgi:DNA helicase-2/ATP-dependent DNA helicase PcrA